MDVQLIPVEKLELDLSNPRIARVLEMYKPSEVGAEQIALALGAGDTQEGETYATYHSLKESIRTNEGIIHPIIVNRNKGGKLVVIEGNTRLQIYREFLADKVPGNWSKILAVVHDNLSATQIDAIRLQSHLVGPRPWEAYSKARYLHLLRNQKHMTFEQIVDFCGGRRRQVMEYIEAYKDMETYYRPALPSPDAFDPSRFSAFVELQKPNIVESLLAAKFTKSDFAKWVIDLLIDPLQTVRQLPRILESTKARAIFLKDGAREAIRALEIPPADASLAEATLTQLAQEVQRRLGTLKWQEFMRMKEDPRDECRESLVDMKAQLEPLLTAMDGEGNA